MNILDRLEKLERLFFELSRVGVIESVNHAEKIVNVKLDDTLIIAAQWPAEIGKNFIRWMPLRAGTQVSVLRNTGSEDQYSITGTLFSTEIISDNNADNIDEIKFNDGTAVSYNSNNKTMTITVKGDININTDGDVIINTNGDATIAATNATVTADADATIEAGGNVNIDGSAINLNQGTAGGVVCQSHACSFTGSPHPQGSTTVLGGA
ncbi:phage baseplate assembly protein V [Pseudomonas sp. HK3]